jgi:hypothetical protein
MAGFSHQSTVYGWTRRWKSLPEMMLCWTDEQPQGPLVAFKLPFCTPEDAWFAKKTNFKAFLPHMSSKAQDMHLEGEYYVSDF